LLQTLAYCLALALGSSLCACAAEGAASDGGDAGADACGPLPHTGCAPEIDGAVYALEGEAIAVEAHCADGRAIEEVGVCHGALPKGAVYDGKHTLKWTPGRDQAAVYDFGAGKIQVADRWDAPDNQPVDPLRYTEEYGLPVFHLWTTPEFSDAAHSPVRLIYKGHEFTAVEAKYRGATSLTYPKKSFTIKFDGADPFSDAEHGMADARRRLVLTTTFDDNSYLRQRMAFELWNRLQPTVEVGAYNAVLFLNGQYHGLYTVSDHVDDELGAAFGLWEGSNLYKARSHNANLRLTDAGGKKKKAIEQGYTKEEGEPEQGEPGAFDDLHELITWISTADDTEFAGELDQRVERADFEDWMLLASVIDARDSAGKNVYLYHDARTDADDPRWHCVPWDFNESFGQTWRTARLESTGPLARYEHSNALFEGLAKNPELSAAVRARYAEAMNGSWSLPSVLELFDAHVAEIDAAARRDEEKWQADFRAFDWGGRSEFDSYEEEVDYVRAYIEARWAFVHEQYP
jgi:spore coat protein H